MASPPSPTQIARLLVKRPRSALRNFLKTESAGGLILIAAAGLAILVANSDLSAAYFGALKAYVGPLSVLHWINDALMAIFFLLVGLEVKRELLDGELATWPRRILPGVAALAGIVLPALIYAGFNRDDPAALRGWAIPAATDIAFALGVLALLGKRAPASLKILLTAIAIIDDLGAIIIIALFYTSGLALVPLAGAAAGLALLALLNLRGVRALWPYLLIGAGVWYGVLLSGVHATLAGVAVALAIPVTRTMGRPDAEDSPLHRLEHAIQPWVAFLIVPIFGFANAGVSFSGVTAAMLTSGVTLGIALGLFVGKQLAIFGSIWALVKADVVDLPAEASWQQVYGMAVLCGIGFTMSLFIGLLAFDGSAALETELKLGVLGGSLLSAVAGFLVLRLAARRPGGD